MKKTYVVFVTPDIYRPGPNKALNALKRTNLPNVEIVVVDNCYDEGFRHPKVMQKYLGYAAGSPVVFLDDDVLIDDPDWLSKLHQCAIHSGASVVGCIHTYLTGDVNHTGILAYTDGTTEMMNDDSQLVTANRFVPALSSAVMLIVDSNAVNFDTQFQKYHHDSDICLLAWSKGLKVACANDLKVVHHIAGFMSTLPRFREILEEDAQVLKRKWESFLKNQAYDIPELSPFKSIAAGFNWETLYNEASRNSASQPDKSMEMFREISISCPFAKRKAGAFFHIYLLGHNKENLRRCLELNPNHILARKYLEELG